jgi:hypothetical protein
LPSENYHNELKKQADAKLLRAAERAELLTRLGITAAEANLLLGA